MRKKSAFFTEALPCEVCGEPTHRPRQWNAGREVWTAVDCSCSIPEQPVCPDLLPEINQAGSIRELIATCKEHKKTCKRCAPVEMPRPVRRQYREAA
jgi:hypothetical protein